MAIATKNKRVIKKTEELEKTNVTEIEIPLLSKKPLKARNLKVIDYLGTLYATFDGSSMWKIDHAAFNVLKMCDGKKTVDQIVDAISKKIFHRSEDVKPVIENILDNLTRSKFIVWV